MAISKSDCLLLLKDIYADKAELNKVMSELIRSDSPPINVIKFINDRRQLDVTEFYKKIRKSYNDKRSKLYINIVREIEDPSEVLTTLAAMQTQILLFAKTAEDRQMFLRHARSAEIASVLLNYFKTYDITSCLKLLKLIKVDIKALEYISSKEQQE